MNATSEVIAHLSIGDHESATKVLLDRGVAPERATQLIEALGDAMDALAIATA